MSHSQRPWDRDRTQSDPAETLLDYVSRAGIAITALLAVAAVAGILVVFLPMNETIATVVFTGLLVAVAAYTYRVSHRRSV